MKAPVLRFKKFKANWSQIHLGDLLSFKNGINASKEDYGHGYKFINVLDIIQNDTILYESIIGSVNVSEKEYEKNIVEYGDILFQRSSETREEVGQSNVYLDKKKPATFGGFVIRGKMISEYEPMFLNFLLKTQSARKEITTKSGGSTRYNVSQSTLSEASINLPSLPEQKKIADFLSTVDQKIQALIRKKEHLENYKKGVMQKIFTYDHINDKSKLRNGRLEDYGYFYYGKGAPKTSIKPEGKTPCVRYGELYSTYGELIDKIKSYTVIPPEHLKLSKGGEVLVPRVGEDPLEFANCSYLPMANVAIGEMISVYNTDESGLFMTYYINAMLKKELAKHVEGGNVSNLYFRYVQRIEVLIPNIEEQNRIVKVLSLIDQKINIVGTQIDKMQEWKKGLLQQMFV